MIVISSTHDLLLVAGTMRAVIELSNFCWGFRMSQIHAFGARSEVFQALSSYHEQDLAIAQEQDQNQDPS